MQQANINTLNFGGAGVQRTSLPELSTGRKNANAVARKIPPGEITAHNLKELRKGQQGDEANDKSVKTEPQAVGSNLDTYA